MKDFENKLLKAYNDFEKYARKETLARTIDGRDVCLFRFGTGESRFLLTAGIHGREWITVLLVTELVLREKGTFSFDCIPCLNPDGCCLAADGAESVRDPNVLRNLYRINGKKDFSQWKANARGVDVNVNFDADWGEGRYNRTSPAPSDYIGREPGSENETKAAIKALERSYPLIVCYHSLGEEVYWGYEHNFRHYEEAKIYADHLGYKLKRSEHSCGGMKDFYALSYPGLGLTVEVGEEKYGHPYPAERLPVLLEKHKGTIPLLAGLGDKIHDGIHGGGAERSEESV